MDKSFEDQLIPKQDGLCKRFIKKMILSAFGWMLTPIIQKIQERDAYLENRVNKHLDDLEKRMGATARDLIRTKWQLRDYLASLQDDSNIEMTCMICGHKAPIRSLKTVETNCIFAGGHLVRYECPECGCIFGARKVLAQSPQELADDYTVHYSGFQEGDSTWKELDAFKLLEPTKSGVYLDYGCGKWSRTVNELRKEGYTVFGFEPYADDVDNPYIITDKNKLAGMRFDGIFSNDVMEHLTDPVGDMRFMKSLLRTKDSKMSHCTSCYAYKYEYTRFHLNFFVGKSVQVLAEKAGLTICKCVNELADRDFYCYVFGTQDRFADLMSRMYGVPADGHALRAGRDRPIFGPYLTLPAGQYRFHANLTIEGERDTIPYRITAGKGRRELFTGSVKTGENEIFLSITELTEDIEFVIQPQDDACSVQLDTFSMEL